MYLDPITLFRKSLNASVHFTTGNLRLILGVSGFLNVVIVDKGIVILDQSMIIASMKNHFGLNRSTMDTGKGLMVIH
jgi:hypothetical protein